MTEQLAAAATAALRTRGLTVRFGRFTAVDGVDIAVAAGARHALIGPNGAGKTSLVHALTGKVAPASGAVLLGGQDVTALPERKRVRQGLARTFQINQLFRNQTVLENVALAVFEREGKTRSFWSSARRDRAVLEEARAQLAFVNLLPYADQPVHRLAYGQQRVLEIAIALASRPRVLILDEPAAGVPSAESEAIFERLHALPEDLTILFVEHDMNLVFRFARRITVLVAGRVLAEGTPAEISADERVRAVYLGRRGHQGPGHQGSDHQGRGVTPLLEIQDLTAGYGDAIVLEGVSLRLHQGESVAVLGRNGVGKTTLMLTIMGHARLRGGTVRWDGADLTRLAPSERARAGLGWVPQERDIFPSLTVEENLLVARRPGRMDLDGIYGLFPRLRERRRNMGDRLSGGEQQMLAIGRTLMTNPRLLLLDEPFEGLAPVIVDELEDTMQRLRQGYGFAILIVEQHAEDVLRLSDRAIVLDRGRIVLEDQSQALLDDLERVQRWIAV